MSKVQLSVANQIKALALINVKDIFKFMITATDEEIEDRYINEERAVKIAEKYIDIASSVEFIEHKLNGFEMNYSMPVKDSEDRVTHHVKFYNWEMAESEEEHE